MPPTTTVDFAFDCEFCVRDVDALLTSYGYPHKISPQLQLTYTTPNSSGMSSGFHPLEALFGGREHMYQMKPLTDM